MLVEKIIVGSYLTLVISKCRRFMHICKWSAHFVLSLYRQPRAIVACSCCHWVRGLADLPSWLLTIQTQASHCLRVSLSVLTLPQGFDFGSCSCLAHLLAWYPCDRHHAETCLPYLRDERTQSRHRVSGQVALFRSCPRLQPQLLAWLGTRPERIPITVSPDISQAPADPYLHVTRPAIQVHVNVLDVSMIAK